MKKLYFLLTVLALLSARGLAAQDIVTPHPSPLQENSEDVYIIFHADLGNQGCMGLTSSTPVYAHTGVITNKSNGSWAYAPTWLDNSDKYRLEYDGPNTWRLEIGDIREYYGITDPDEVVQQLAFVFRNATGSKEGKTATGGDIFVDVLPDGFQLSFTSDASTVLNSSTATVTFTAQTTAAADINIYIDSTTSTPIASATNATSLVKSYTFSQGFSGSVIATATDGTTTETKTLTVCYPKDSEQKAYPGGGTPQMGAVAQADGSVIFCIAAPGKKNALLIGSWADYKASEDAVMYYTDVNDIRYFWTQVSGLDPDTEYPYYYLIDSSYAVGDPYARLVLDPYSDKWLEDGTYAGLIPYPYDKVEGNVMLAVYKGNRSNEYKWNITDFKGVDASELVIYEMLIRDFTGTEGQAKGNGTLAKAMDKLDYLKTLGINAVELMPIMEFNGNNSWGYNTNFYFAPDKAYGTPAQYKQFIDACHERGMAVILDIVFNQSDGLHPWYQLYESGSNPFYNATAPHAYSVLNDWSQDNLLVQQQWHDCLRYWMEEFKVDGFRFDLVKGLGDNNSYGTNSDSNTNKYNATRIARMKELTDVIKSVNPNGYSINENLATASEENAMFANGGINWANINNAACQFAMGYSSDSNCSRFYAPKDSRTWGSTVSYAESHDEQRMGYKQDTWGVTGVKGNLDVSMVRLGSVAAQMLLCPGAHMIWQFGELGNATNTKDSSGGNNTDPKPVYWSYYDVPQRRALYNTYAELISIRTLNPTLFSETATFSINCAATNWSSGRTLYAANGSSQMVCVINPTVDQLTITGVDFMYQSNDNYKVLTSSYECPYSYDASTGSVTLQGGAFICLGTQDLSVVGVDKVITDDVTARNYTVSGGMGEIVITGDYQTARVYNVYGRQFPTLRVPAGVYVVVVDGTASKVLVK